MPPNIFLVPIVPSEVSKAGSRYRVADGHRVPNIGQQAVRFRTDEDLAAGLLFQTAEIVRPLVSASQPAAAGNRVIFSDEGGEIVNKKTSKRTSLHKRRSIYVLRMRILDSPENSFGQRR